MSAIAGAIGVPNAAFVTSMMLLGLQHRDQTCAGGASFHQGKLHEHRGYGMVDDVFGDIDINVVLPGDAAIGGLRHAPNGGTDDFAALPPIARIIRGTPVAMAHNGTIINHPALRKEFELRGGIYQSGSDTESILHLMARAGLSDVTGALLSASRRMEGSWSLLTLTPGAMYMMVDPHGFRPLAFGRYGGGWVFASETCALDLIGATDRSHAERGKLLQFTRNPDSWTSWYTGPTPQPAARKCLFEYIYNSRPDSEPYGNGLTGGDVRDRLGMLLAARETPGFTADLVCSVPDSSNDMAVAYARATGIRFQNALIRNHYAGPRARRRRRTDKFGVRVKLNPVRPRVEGKSVVVVDDSAIEGETLGKVVRLLLDAGAREVHVRIASAPVVHPCHLGIDIPEREQLVAATKSPLQFAADIGAKSLAYLDVHDVRAAVDDRSGRSHCDTCFTGIWPLARPADVPDVPASALIRSHGG